jgi:hypothetical protein
MASQLLTLASLTVASLTVADHCQTAIVSALRSYWLHVVAHGDPRVNVIHHGAVYAPSFLPSSTYLAHCAGAQRARSFVSIVLRAERHQSHGDLWHAYPPHIASAY